ncbi:MAG: hypothetical protein JWQ39_2326 [Glaciihabitans sp.]|jgi:hypothetical protein|nr:hypothetical protein [Glaciihabitans sp.]
MTTSLGDLAELVRSKNAGPFWLTIDVFLATEHDYIRARNSLLTDPAHIAAVFEVPASTVRIFTLPNLNAIKVSLPRPHVQGSLRDTDLHGGQQYVPLLAIPVD